MSNPTHPHITFSVNLANRTTEDIGPITNLISTRVLHPDMYDNDEDRGYLNSLNHRTQFSSWIPGLTVGENRKLADDATFTAYGARATYLQKNFTTGAFPLLTVDSQTFESA